MPQWAAGAANGGSRCVRFELQLLPWMPDPRWAWTRGGVVAALLLVASAVGVATLTYLAIERPMLRLKSRIPPEPRASPSGRRLR